MSTPNATAPRVRGVRIGVVVPVSLGVVALVVLAAVLGVALVPQDPGQQHLLTGATGPSSAHWLGTDDLGRDIFARLVAGTRTAVLGPAVAALGTTLVGLVLGLLAGFRGGLVDEIIMRTTDFVYAVPALLVIIVVVGLFSGSYWVAVAVLVLLAAPGATRIVRAAVLAQRGLPYVEAARTLGLRDRRLMLVHITPNVLPTVVTGLLLEFSAALVALSALSFLGLGVPPGAADWGRMVAENRALLQLNAWSILAPALMLAITASAVTAIGDWLHERLERRATTHD